MRRGRLLFRKDEIKDEIKGTLLLSSADEVW